MTQQQTHALSLMQAGFKLTVLNGKRPILDEWQNNPIDAATVQSHVGNFGIITGHGFFVFDVDNIDSFMFFLMENGLTMPNDTTCTVETAKGFHYYFTLPSTMQSISNGVRLGKSDAFPKGFGDIRGTGGQVVAPGGIHPETGKTYTANNLPIATCPEWLETLIASHGVREAHLGSRGEVLIESDDVFAIDRATTYLKRAEPAIEGNGGDHQTFATFARLRDFGISLETAVALAEEHWNPRNQPPWMPDDLRIKAENAYNYAANPQGIANPLAAFQSIGLTPSAPAVQPTPAAPPQPTPAAPPQPVSIPAPNTLAGIDPYDVSMGVGYEKNHTTNAARFIQEWYPGATLRHFDDTWYFYDGKCWVEVKEEAMSRALTVAMANASPSASDVSGTLKILKGMVGRKGSLGTFGYRDVSSLLLVQNGILNVATGTLEPHSPDFFTTNILPFAYDPTATCPTWERFIGEVWPEQQDSIDLLEEWIAYNMLRDYSHQKILMMIGASRGGKGTIGRVMLQLIGELNYHGISLEGFANDRVLEGALTKTCLFVGDAMSVSGPNRSKIVERLKTISGGDNTSCARAYKTPFSGVIPGRITIACNNILSFNDDSGTLAKRLLILPFNRSFEGREDPELNAKLSAELPGIANRCIKALARLRSRGRFVEPESAAVERESITYRYSPVQAFVDDECTLGSEERVHCEELYARYKAWCMRSSVRCIPHRPFVDAVRGLMRGKIEKKAVSIGGVRLQGFVGLGLRPDAQPENVTPFPVQGGH